MHWGKKKRVNLFFSCPNQIYLKPKELDYKADQKGYYS